MFTNTLYLSIAEHMESHDYMWNFNGDYRVPNENEVKEVLDKARAALYDSKDGSHFMAGRLIVVKMGDHYDVYVHLGEIND